LLIIVYLLLIVFIGSFAAFVYLHIRNQSKKQELSLSDKTNIVMIFVNLVFLILAVVSIHIAVKSYQAAQESGKQQQQTLDASKDSLSSVVVALKKQQETLEDSRQALRQSVSIIAEQQVLLQQSVKTSRNQLAVLDAQWKRQLEQTDIARQQLQLSKDLAHLGVEPYVDCDLVFPGPNEKDDPYIWIINKSPISVSSLTVDGYAMPFDSIGKGGHSIQRRTYPGHLLFRKEFGPMDFAKTSVMRVPPPHHRSKDIVKVFYVFDLTYQRSADLTEFKNRVAFELFEDGQTRVQRVKNLLAHPYYGEIETSIRSQRELIPRDAPEEYLKY
jgi:hypothetical protein